MARPSHPDASTRPPRLVDRLSRPFARFLAIEASSSVVLLLATVVALLWANSEIGDSYAALWHAPLGFSFGSHSLVLPLEAWVNDALMAIFFFVVGMEIKHELVEGELSSRARAMLPVFGAVGGMVVPAGIYVAFHSGGPALSGWGIPMATDIAFAVAALAVFGARVPSGLKIFLLALAIVDDLGAVAVIALFYTDDISGIALALTAAGFVLTYGLNRAGVRAIPVYWVVGATTWLAMHESGVHATVAGVLLGLLTPTHADEPDASLAARARHNVDRLLDAIQGQHEREKRQSAARDLRVVGRAAVSPLDLLTKSLHPWVAFLIMPIFALANAGVVLEAEMLGDPEALRVSLAVAAGLLVGKPVGITAASWLAVRLGIAELPGGVGWGAIAATGLLAGIGFTMSLFITALAFSDPDFVAASKVGILAASTLAALSGMLLLARTLPRPTER